MINNLHHVYMFNKDQHMNLHYGRWHCVNLYCFFKVMKFMHKNEKNISSYVVERQWKSRRRKVFEVVGLLRKFEKVRINLFFFFLNPTLIWIRAFRETIHKTFTESSIFATLRETLKRFKKLTLCTRNLFSQLNPLHRNPLIPVSKVLMALCSIP